jgi:hypothetical protein|tara:strand:+ start:3794 stop:4183 length:390 start_codon:yes stop_codon:yes gene_type:complete
MIDYEDVAHHIHALKCTFELIGREKNVTADELVAIRQEIVKQNGKYDIDWKNDWLGKLAADYYYCIEQDSRLEEKNFLSANIRMRLYRMATMNKNVKSIWKQLPELDPKCFLQEEEQKTVNVKNKWKYK